MLGTQARPSSPLSKDETQKFSRNQLRVWRNSRMREVRGIEGLRVAAASIMPSITNVPSMMIDWKCGDMITRTRA